MKICCRHCIHYKEAPYVVRKTGCWHPEKMPQKHGEAYLDEQQIPGNHAKINLRNDCDVFEARPDRPRFHKRLWEALLGRKAEGALTQGS